MGKIQPSTLCEEPILAQTKNRLIAFQLFRPLCVSILTCLMYCVAPRMIALYKKLWLLDTAIWSVLGRYIDFEDKFD